MDFAFSEEQEMLRAAAREWLADRYPADRVAELADSDAGWDPASWTELTELGWLDPELGLLEHAVLAEEAGYALLPAPWLSSVGLAGARARRPARRGRPRWRGRTTRLPRCGTRRPRSPAGPTTTWTAGG